MQVNNVQQSPNFGMAVKIKPSASEFLKKQSMKTLETLEQLGEEFKDYKHWDLEVDELGYRVAGKGALDGAYRNISRPAEKDVRIDSFTVSVTADRFADKGKKIDKYLIYPTRDEATNGFDKIHNTTNELETTAAFLRELENLSAQKAYEAALKAQAEQAQAAKINNLLGKFGVEA